MMTNREVQQLIDQVLTQVNQAFADDRKRLEKLEAEVADLKKPNTKPASRLLHES